ncbi:GDSL esterase/lipase-like protein [Tanacetum coccineum]
MKVFIVLLALLGVHSQAIDVVKVRQMAAKNNVSCLYVFGDSSVDPGNNNNLKTDQKVNFLPYGKDFYDSRPTGRFTNGRLATDLIADALGHAKIIPAYLDPNLTNAQLLNGISFASGGSGFDNLTAEISELHAEGARRLAMVGMEPFGCVPLMRVLRGSTGCDDVYNKVALTFNTKIKSLMAPMASLKLLLAALQFLHRTFTASY